MVTKLLKRTAFLIAIPLLIWTGYWSAFSYLIEHGLSLASQNTPSSKPTVQFEVAAVTGYPQNFSVGITDVEFGTKDSVTWATPQVFFEAKSYLPNEVNLDLSQPHSISGAIGSLEIDARIANLIFLFQPNMQLSLGKLDALFEDVSFSFEGQLTTNINRVFARVEASPKDDNTYLLNANIENFDLSNLIVGLPGGYQYIQNLSFKADVLLTRPLDRFVVDNEAPALQKLLLQKAQITYGTTSISLDGTLAYNKAGTLDGNLNVTVQEWKSLFELAKGLGYVEADLEEFFYSILLDLAKQEESENSLKIPLIIRNNNIIFGALTLGFLP